jgi:drug/metabolite transporter (DMT)-like permease
LVSAVALVFSSFCIFDLFRQESAAAVSIGQAITPVPALAFSSVLLASPISGWQAVGDLIVAACVLAALGPAFGELSRVRALVTVGLAAGLQGLLVVLTKLLANRGVGVANRGVGVGQIYVTRTALAGVLACMLVFPRDIPVRAIPPLALRAALQSSSFVLTIFAVERGSPSTVQTLVAATPLMVLTMDTVASARRPPLRLILAAAAVLAGVGLSVA